jgi:hypothetical protein
MPRRPRLRWFILGAVAILVTGIIVYLLAPGARPTGTSTLQPVSGSLNILIIGKDARAVGPVRNEGRRRNQREAESRSDIIIVAHVNFDRPSFNLVAIPRDLLVEVPGHTAAASRTDFANMEKITHTHAIGGEKLLRRTVEHLLGIRIQRSIAFDFDSFRMAFDLLRPFVGILRVGSVTLAERDQALKFARKRYGLKFDDADRCRNAVGLVRAIVKQTWWLAGTRLGDHLVRRILAIVGPDTDLTRDEIARIIDGLRVARFEPDAIRTAVLVSAGAEVTLNRYKETLSCYLPVYYEIEKQADHFLRDRDDVAALDFMTQQDFRYPAYLDDNYVAPADSAPPAPADTEHFDSVRGPARDRPDSAPSRPERSEGAFSPEPARPDSGH